MGCEASRRLSCTANTQTKPVVVTNRPAPVTIGACPVSKDRWEAPEMTPEATDIHLLVARALAGEQDAVEGVILAIQDDVYGLALRMLGERTAAEDATQEILLQVLTCSSGEAGGSARSLS
jgi:hypothetical protein